MKLTGKLNHEYFGDFMRTQRGVARYTISPYEQSAFKGFFSKGIPNYFNKFVKYSPFYIALFAGVYINHVLMTDSYDKHCRKHPGQFDHEE